jgi:hypothetical protein
MAEINQQLKEIRAKIDQALSSVESDGAASPVLTAVVREFSAKAEKASRTAGAGAERDAVVELEQAGDSAKAAAEADPGAGEASRKAVLDAHLAICKLKASL